MAIMAQLEPEEEQWREVYLRLCERFQNFPPARVLEVLRKHDGHAGQTAAALRDLMGTDLRPVDPDDAEHVKTLLSSPLMFGQACKEEFRKFDKNGDGVLDLPETVTLTTNLYENFGLQAPREGSIRAFFDATDTNRDGVLNEKEFKKFFEMFLRHAFFDVVSRGDRKQTERAEDPEEEAPAPEPPSRKHALVAEEPGPAAPPASRKDRAPPGDERTRRSDRRMRGGQSAGGAFRCIAPDGVQYRASAVYQDRLEKTVQRGETVQALEYWVRTADGWLPLCGSSGQMLFEKVHGSAQEPRERARTERGQEPARTEEPSAPGPAAAEPPAARPAAPEPAAAAAAAEEASAPPPKQKAAGAPRACEPLPEDWRERAERLCERFPEAGAERVAQALRHHGGHAGKAAKELRDAVADE